MEEFGPDFNSSTLKKKLEEVRAQKKEAERQKQTNALRETRSFIQHEGNKCADEGYSKFIIQLPNILTAQSKYLLVLELAGRFQKIKCQSPSSILNAYDYFEFETGVTVEHFTSCDAIHIYIE